MKEIIKKYLNNELLVLSIVSWIMYFVCKNDTSREVDAKDIFLCLSGLASMLLILLVSIQYMDEVNKK